MKPTEHDEGTHRRTVEHENLDYLVLRPIFRQVTFSCWVDYGKLIDGHTLSYLVL